MEHQDPEGDGEHPAASGEPDPEALPPMPEGTGVGWYPDPAVDGQLRFWHSSGWTHHVKDVKPSGSDESSTASEPGASTPASSTEEAGGCLSTIGVLLIVMLAIGGCMQLLGIGGDPSFTNSEVETCFNSLILITEDYSGTMDFCEDRFGN